MRLDLSFQDAAAEAEFRRLRLAQLRHHEEAIEWTRLLTCACFAARLALLRASPGSIAAALLACLAAGAQLAMCGRGDLRCVRARTVPGCALGGCHHKHTLPEP